MARYWRHCWQCGQLVEFVVVNGDYVCTNCHPTPTTPPVIARPSKDVQ